MPPHGDERHEREDRHGDRRGDRSTFSTDAPRAADAPRVDERTTVRAEKERREAFEREQREHPDEIAGRGRDPWHDVAGHDVEAEADDDSERFRARDNENLSEG